MLDFASMGWMPIAITVFAIWLTVSSAVAAMQHIDVRTWIVDAPPRARVRVAGHADAIDVAHGSGCFIEVEAWISSCLLAPRLDVISLDGEVIIHVRHRCRLGGRNRVRLAITAPAAVEIVEPHEAVVSVGRTRSAPLRDAAHA